MRAIFLTLLFTVTASAQTLEQLASIRLDEQPMSARAAAMGGASDALSSDASDLAVNPALIASLKRPVLSISGAETTYDTYRFELRGLDVVTVREADNQRALAHVSAAIPWRGAVIGLYARNEPRIAYLTLHDDDGAGLGAYVPVCTGDDCGIVFGDHAWDRRERRYGVTAAFERGAFSFGAGAELQELDETYELVRAPLSNVSVFNFDRVTYRTAGSKVVPNAGVRWRIHPRVALAAAYNGGGEHDRTEDVCSVSLFNARCSSELVRVGTGKAGGADALRASISVAPMERLTVTAEAVRRNYGKLGAGYRDTTDLHAGAEVRLPRLPISLRAGWLRQPAKFEGFDFLELPSGSVEHRTYGVGLDVAGARIDVAYDDADAPAFRRAVVGVTFGVR
jgi:hypothetical protein